MSGSLLLIGGMDSSGGAGILRDAATALDLGAATRVAVTAVTAQNDRGVLAIHPLPAHVVRAQIEAAKSTPIGAIKIGMLGTAETVSAVAESCHDVPLVLDPVLRSTSGYDLLTQEGLAALFEILLPRTHLLTPNLPELAQLAAYIGLPGATDEATIVRALLVRGCRAVFVKGGHAADQNTCEDRLYQSNGTFTRYTAPRIQTALRGTGCQLATALAIHLSRGVEIEIAAALSKQILSDRFAKAAATDQQRERTPSSANGSVAFNQI